MSALVASPAVKGRSPSDPIRAMQHALYRAAKADPGLRFHAPRDKVYRRDVLWRAWEQRSSQHRGLRRARPSSVRPQWP